MKRATAEKFILGAVLAGVALTLGHFHLWRGARRHPAPRTTAECMEDGEPAFV